VLFLDEAPEFQRAAIELLREPLEDGVVRLTRAAGSIEYPAAMMLVLASNPCPCGNRGSRKPCRCVDGEVSRYQRRISGPILDRIDLYVELQSVAAGDLLQGAPGETSEAVRERVCAARSVQADRGQPVPNARLSPAALDEVARATPEARDLLYVSVEAHGLSGRSAHRLLKVARTIADLAGEARVEAIHVGEALAYRPLGAFA
jgi:magnesium chelatase family protein